MDSINVPYTVIISCESLPAKSAVIGHDSFMSHPMRFGVGTTRFVYFFAPRMGTMVFWTKFSFNKMESLFGQFRYTILLPKSLHVRLVKI
jgi:hypothetical protein